MNLYYTNQTTEELNCRQSPLFLNESHWYCLVLKKKTKTVVESSTALEYVTQRCCSGSSSEVLKAQRDKDTDFMLAAVALWAGGYSGDLHSPFLLPFPVFYGKYCKLIPKEGWVNILNSHGFESIQPSWCLTWNSELIEHNLLKLCLLAKMPFSSTCVN